MAIGLYINFRGNCREAVEFYSDVFETEKPQIMTFGDAPSDPEYPISEETKGLVLHAALNIKGSNVMFSDTPADMPFTQGNNITLVISSNNIDEIKSLFSKLKEGGNVIMDLQETFWSKCYGFLTDKYGIGWQISYDSVEMKI
jgi:PhnB protein